MAQKTQSHWSTTLNCYPLFAIKIVYINSDSAARVRTDWNTPNFKL